MYRLMMQFEGFCGCVCETATIIDSESYGFNFMAPMINHPIDGDKHFGNTSGSLSYLAHVRLVFRCVNWLHAVRCHISGWFRVERYHAHLSRWFTLCAFLFIDLFK